MKINSKTAAGGPSGMATRIIFQTSAQLLYGPCPPTITIHYNNIVILHMLYNQLHNAIIQLLPRHNDN